MTGELGTLGLYAPPAATGGAGSTDEADKAGSYLSMYSRFFLSLEPKILEWQHRAAIAAGKYKAEGRPELAELAKDVIRELGALNIAYGRARDDLVALIQKVPGLGAPVLVPVAYAAAVITLAATVAAIFRKATAQEQMLEMLEAGTLTPEEAARLKIQGAAPGGPFTDLANAGKWLTVGLGIFLAYQYVRDR